MAAGRGAGVLVMDSGWTLLSLQQTGGSRIPVGASAQRDVGRALGLKAASRFRTREHWWSATS